MTTDPGVRAAVTALGLALCAATAGCATPVRAERVGADAVYERIHESVLSGDDPSVAARLVLERAGLAAAWDDDRGAAMAELHRAAEAGDTRERLYGLAELSLAEARRTGDRRWDLGAAVYAGLFLFGSADVPPPGPFDPRFRLACDIYERGLAGAFTDPDTGEFRPQGGEFPLPVGSITIACEASSVRVGDTEFDEFHPAIDFAVEGMRSRVRREGIGVPLVAGRRVVPQRDATPVPGTVAPNARTSATAVLDFSGELADLRAGSVRGTLSLRSQRDGATVRVRGADVPLAADSTAPIASALTESRLWSHELLGFLWHDRGQANGLFPVYPYERGKIPLVLVHGTASSPARWAELLNELASDPEIAGRYQPWVFVYRTGLPVLVSARSLREAIRDTVAAVDPEGTDEALSRMVVVGHSQGGLLTRLMVTESGDRFWRNVSDEPIGSLDLDPETRRDFDATMFFSPVPQVRRVVFLATPHRGSFVAGGIAGRIGSSLVSLPSTLAHEFSDAVTRNFARATGDRLGALPTAVDNMEPDSPFCRALAELPTAPGVRVNSIVAVDGDGAPEEGDDGVVAWESAHFPGAESEIVVRSPHSCQGDPRTILEVRRILREHVRAGR